RAATLAQERLPDGPLYVIPDLLSPARPTFDLLLRGNDVKNIGAAGCLAYFDRSPRPVTYLFDMRHAGDTLDGLQATYAGQGTVETIVHPPTGETLFAAYTVPAGAAVAYSLQPASAAFGALDLLG